MFSPLFLPSEAASHWHSGSSSELCQSSCLAVSLLFFMPVAVMTAEEQNAAISQFESTLSAILEEKGVRRDVQATLANLGILTCETFAVMESTAENMRAWLHSDDIGLSRQGADKVQAAKVITAWESAVGRVNTQRQQDAEQRAAGLPAVIPGGVFVTMRRAWEANMSPGQTLSPSELPAKSFIEWRQAQVDDGEFLTESLAEVSSQQEESAQTDDHTQADFVREGSKAVIRVRRTKVKSTMPATTEQLRHKYRLLAVHWGMLSQRYPNKSWAKDYDPATLRNHVDWLLGEHVAELRAVSPSGEEAIGPSWPVVLRYELEVRKEAMRQINMFSVSLATAFAAGRRSDELRTRYLITPLALGGTQKKQQDNRPTEERTQKQKYQQPRQQPSSQSGPKKKGVRQRAAKRQREAALTSTEASSRYNKARRLCPDAFHQVHNGKSICFAFQGPKGCSRGQSCKHQHICAHCFGAHPYEKCPNNVESRAAYLKQRLHSIRFARRSHNSAISSQKEGTVGVPTVPAVLLPIVTKRASPVFLFWCRVKVLVWAFPHQPLQCLQAYCLRVFRWWKGAVWAYPHRPKSCLQAYCLRVFLLFSVVRAVWEFPHCPQ